MNKSKTVKFVKFSGIFLTVYLLVTSPVLMAHFVSTGFGEGAHIANHAAHSATTFATELSK